jgi:hypothetical protein
VNILEKHMTEPLKAQGRTKIEIWLLPVDRAALDRCCECLGITMTRFIGNRIRECERRMLARLTGEQRAAFLAGELRWDPLCDGEVTHDEAAAIRQRAGNGVQPQSSPMSPTASAR